MSKGGICLGMEVGKRIKKFRIENNLTQKQFADKIGLNHSIISYIEAGKRNLSPETIKIISKILNVTPSELIGDKSLKERLEKELTGNVNLMNNYFKNLREAMSEIIKNLVSLRNINGYTIKELALACGYSSSYISHVYVGRQELTLSGISKMVNAYNKLSEKAKRVRR